MMRAADPAAPGAMTVLRSRGRCLCKIITPSGTTAYDDARTFDVHAVAVPDLAALAEALARLASARDCCAVLAAPADPARVRRVRRLLYADRDTGEAATLRAVPRSWLALDFDDAPLPTGCDPRDLGACASALLPLLPPSFTGAGMVVQASASHGIKPGIRLRLWPILSRPVTAAEAVRLLWGTPKLDACSFREAQPIYVAAPIFADGATDPLPSRLHVVPGPPVPVPDAAALAPPPPPPPRPLPRPADTRVSRYAYAALAQAAARVRGAEGTRHTCAVTQAMGLERLVRAGLLTETAVAHALAGALGEGRADPDEAAKLTKWALAHADDGRALPEGIA